MKLSEWRTIEIMMPVQIYNELAIFPFCKYGHEHPKYHDVLATTTSEDKGKNGKKIFSRSMAVLT